MTPAHGGALRLALVMVLLSLLDPSGAGDGGETKQQQTEILAIAKQDMSSDGEPPLYTDIFGSCQVGTEMPRSASAAAEPITTSVTTFTVVVTATAAIVIGAATPTSKPQITPLIITREATWPRR